MKNKVKIAVIVPAAGIGSRMQCDIPKQYLKINNKSVLQHTIEKLQVVEHIDLIKVALSADDTWFSELNLDTDIIQTVIGGETRAQTVLNALASLKALNIDWVLVHDAARPLVKQQDIENLIAQTISSGIGGLLAYKVKDTIKKVTDQKCTTVPREDLWHAMTPQMFSYEKLHHALQSALDSGIDITDEASAMEWAGYPVRLIAGRSDNIKITTPEDLTLASFYLNERDSL